MTDDTDNWRQPDDWRQVDPRPVAPAPPPKMPPKIAAALVKATREAEAVEKNKRMEGGKFSYSFAGADALMTEARAALAKAGLAIVLTGWEPHVTHQRDWAEDGKEVQWMERSVLCRFTLVHEDGDTWCLDQFSMPSLPGPGRPVDKADASALTYATGYVMRGLLNLPRVEPGQQVDERDDSDHAPKTQRRGPSAEEKREAEKANAIAAIEDALSTVTDLPAWLSSYGAKANRAVGMEALRDVVGKRVTALGIPEGPVLAELAKVVAAAKR